ncbi:PBDC1 protein, partial [Origma solitaria]|nr:PBDC1 protein [Origma solitaria]
RGSCGGEEGPPRGDLSPGWIPALPDPCPAPQPRVELAWAMKAHQHAQVYFNVSRGAPRGTQLTPHLPMQLISSVDPKFLNLTKVDDRIYEEFRKTFRDLRIDVLDPEELKSEPAKEVSAGHGGIPPFSRDFGGAEGVFVPQKWRPFCLGFEGVVEDFNYGTLLRLDSRREYTEENTIFATRIQFFAIEIARNREGCNDEVYRSSRE